jgi:hypothetical protein
LFIDPEALAGYTARMKREDRERLLEMAQRRAKPGSGSDLHVLREERADYGGGELFPDLKGVRYVIVGGLATARYMPQRMTLDTDILIATEDLGTAESNLRELGCEQTGALSIGGSTWRMPGGRSLDLISLDQEWVGEALATAVHDADGRPYVDLPYLVLMKLEAGRLQDLADISRMLGCAEEARVDATRALVTRYRPQDVSDLESMIKLGRLECR